VNPHVQVEPGGAAGHSFRAARLLALDVDGVMTDGRVVYAGSKEGVLELQSFDVQDGIALRWLAKAGVKIAWITGRGCNVTEHRARELAIDALEMQVESKSTALERIQARFGIGVDETVAMGDDLPDLGMRVRAGFFVAPANARDEIKARADLVLAQCGGAGAVRELAEAILRARGAWQGLVDAALR
jgi:3-deoxy-D-manno-octulosonate 8-phosphate phosphatase (KDO 8-P phosphatase)